MEQIFKGPLDRESSENLAERELMRRYENDERFFVVEANIMKLLAHYGANEDMPNEASSQVVEWLQKSGGKNADIIRLFACQELEKEDRKPEDERRSEEKIAENVYNKLPPDMKTTTFEA